MRAFALLFGLMLCSLFWAGPASAAPDVEPSPRVVRGVNVRALPDSSSEILGRVAPGDRVELIEVVPAWFLVRLPDGRQGYVSRAWMVQLAYVATAPAYFVHLIDVGTGLAVFVEGRDFNLLYDAGSNDDTARGDRNRVVAYLKRIRPALQRIDHVILSHPHKDHVELMPDVLAAYNVGEIWDSGRTNPICSYRAFLRLIRDRQIAYHDAHPAGGPHQVPLQPKLCYGRTEAAETIEFPHASPISVGQKVQLGQGAALTFLHATAAPVASFNENSLVAVMDLGKSRLLFTGDAEAGGRRPPVTTPSPSSVEGELIACCAADLRADILVVGHHGSKTSSRTAFLDKVGAYVFLVSAGPKRYASVTLPDADVISELRSRGSVYRTDGNDIACGANASKIGPDNDNQPGGCNNVLVEIEADGTVKARSYELND